jgi:hypothetical protein
MVGGVFRLGDRRVTALMTPRVDAAWLDVNLPPEEAARQISASHSLKKQDGVGRADHLCKRAVCLPTPSKNGRP